MFVAAIDDKDQLTQMVRYVHQHYPNLHIIARAVDRNHVYDLWHAGCRDIIRETYDSSARMGRSAFEALGANRPQAEAAVAAFKDADAKSMIEAATHYDPSVPTIENTAYVAHIRTLQSDGEVALAATMQAALKAD